MDCNATPLGGLERAKIQEAGYYEVLTASSQYNVSDLIKLTMEIHKGVERFASEARYASLIPSYPQALTDKSRQPDSQRLFISSSAPGR